MRIHWRMYGPSSNCASVTKNGGVAGTPFLLTTSIENFSLGVAVTVAETAVPFTTIVVCEPAESMLNFKASLVGTPAEEEREEEDTAFTSAMLSDTAVGGGGIVKEEDESPLGEEVAEIVAGDGMSREADELRGKDEVDALSGEADC